MGRRILVSYGLLVAAMAAWSALEPWGRDPLNTSHALPTIGLGLVALPSIVPLIASGVGGVVGRGTFLVLVVLLAWAEAAAVRWIISLGRRDA
jgi:hypothetical protein